MLKWSIYLFTLKWAIWRRIPAGDLKLIHFASFWQPARNTATRNSIVKISFQSENLILRNLVLLSVQASSNSRFCSGSRFSITFFTLLDFKYFYLKSTWHVNWVKSRNRTSIFFHVENLVEIKWKNQIFKTSRLWDFLNL